MPSRPCATHVGRRALDVGALHLACHGALPDQLIEIRLVAVEHAADIVGMAEQVGRADRLVGLLGILGLGRDIAAARRGHKVRRNGAE